MTTGSGAGMSAITTGVTDIMGVVSSMISEITSEPILAALLAAGFVGVALKLFKKIKRAARS